MYRLFLDDNRDPINCATYMYQRGVDCRIYHEEWVIVRSYGQFCDAIKEKGVPAIFAIDHDLADVEELKESLPMEEWFDIKRNKEYTGYDCTLFLLDYLYERGLDKPLCIVHSANPDGAKRIQALLNGYVKKEDGTIEYNRPITESDFEEKKIN